MRKRNTAQNWPPKKQTCLDLELWKLELMEGEEELQPWILGLPWTFHALILDLSPWTHFGSLAKCWDAHVHHYLRQLWNTCMQISTQWSRDCDLQQGHPVSNPFLTGISRCSIIKEDMSQLALKFSFETYTHFGKKVAWREYLLATAVTASRSRRRLSAARRHGLWLTTISNWPPPDSQCICDIFPAQINHVPL